MKKIFSSIMMVAAVLFAASCTSEDLTQNESGENVKVSFSLGLEGISTRAISDGSGANKLVYAVFDEAGNRISGIEAKNEEVTFPATVELTLVKDKKYKVAFWAQNKACSAYSVDKEAMTVTVDYASIKENNDEKRDAFFKTVDVTVKGSTSIDVELKRALAQINVGVTAEDWEAAKKAGATIATSESFIKKAASSLNVLTGATANLVDVEYTAAAIPAEDLVVDGNTYKWLSMSYILVGDGSANGAEQTVLDDLGFKFNYEGGAVEFKSGLKSVPVMRNCRTNIVGTLLTGKANFNITVDNVFADNKNYPNTVAQQLELAATVGGTVTLTENVTLAKSLAVNSDMVINLNGKTITGSFAKSFGAVITVNEGASLNISGGTVNSTAVNGGAAILNNGETIIENATIVGAPSNTATGTASYAVNTNGVGSKLVVKNTNISGRGAIGATNGTKVEVNGGTYHTPAVAWGHAIYANGEGTEVIINDGTFSEGYESKPDNWGMYQIYSGDKAKVIVNGGNFLPWDCANGYDLITATEGQIVISGGVFAENPSSQNGKNYVAAGYHAVQMGDGMWHVIPVEYGMIISTAADLKAFANEVNVNNNAFSGKLVVLDADIDLAGIDWEPIGQTGATTFNGVFDGQNYTISNLSVNSETETGGNYSSGLFGWVETHTAGHGVIKNVKINGATVKGNHNCGALVGYITEKNALVENCHVTGATIRCTNANADANGDKAGALIGNATNATKVKDCTAANSTVSAGRDAGQVIGAAKSANVTGCSATNVTVTSNGTGTGANINNAVIGREL